MTAIQLVLTPDQAQALVSLGAKINGARGGSARTSKKLLALKSNLRKANKARKAIVAA